MFATALLAVAYASPINVIVTQSVQTKQRGSASHCPTAHQQVKITPAILCQKLMLSADLGDGPYFDVRVKDVKPIGATTPYAAPELLCSIQRQWENDEEGVMINGPAADIWSFGCVCYQMLTGDLPFLADHKCAISAPDYLAEELHPAWEEYQATIECQWFWVRLVLFVP